MKRIVILIFIFSSANYCFSQSQREVLLAIRSCDIPQVEALIQKRGVNNYDPPLLHLAINGADTNTVKYLLKSGADPKSTFRFVDYDIKQKLDAISYAAYRGKPDMIKILIEYGIDMNSIGYLGRTPFLSALNTLNTPSFLVFLIEKGADPHAIDQKGNSALDILVNKYEGRINAVWKSTDVDEANADIDRLKALYNYLYSLGIKHNQSKYYHYNFSR